MGVPARPPGVIGGSRFRDLRGATRTARHRRPRRGAPRRRRHLHRCQPGLGCRVVVEVSAVPDVAGIRWVVSVPRFAQIHGFSEVDGISEVDGFTQVDDRCRSDVGPWVTVAGGEHVGQCRQLRGGHGEGPTELDVGPRVGVAAPVARIKVRVPVSGPLVGATVALGTVGGGGHGDQVSGVGQVVGIAPLRVPGPDPTAGPVGIGQRDEVVDVEGAGVLHDGAGERRQPAAAGHQAAVVPQERGGGRLGHEHLVAGV